jgi:hypothetical protein
MGRSGDVRWTVGSYIAPRAYEPRVWAALRGLGYQLVPATTRGRFSDDSWETDLRVVDERHLDRLPAEAYLPRTPIISVSQGAAPAEINDSRVVGSIRAPVTVDALYPLLQEALEDNPRVAARVPTMLPARCTRSDQRWTGAVVDLSVGGCLFRTRRGMDPGLKCNILFPLPLGRMISIRARSLRGSGDCVGFAFEGAAEPSVAAIRDYVTGRLATL